MILYFCEILSLSVGECAIGLFFLSIINPQYNSTPSDRPLFFIHPLSVVPFPFILSLSVCMFILCSTYTPQKYFSHKNWKSFSLSSSQLTFSLPGIRRSLSCSKHKFMSVCTTLKNALMFQSEHNFFAIVATYKRIV
jgi:hypothetical protein